VWHLKGGCALQAEIRSGKFKGCELFVDRGIKVRKDGKLFFPRLEHLLTKNGYLTVQTVNGEARLKTYEDSGGQWVTVAEIRNTSRWTARTESSAEVRASGPVQSLAGCLVAALLDI